MGTNGQSKPRSMEHYLHKQWIGTRVGREEHQKAVEKEKEKRNGKSKK